MCGKWLYTLTFGLHYIVHTLISMMTIATSSKVYVETFCKLAQLQQGYATCSSLVTRLISSFHMRKSMGTRLMLYSSSKAMIQLKLGDDTTLVRR